MCKIKTALLGLAILAFGLSLTYLFPGHTDATAGVNQQISFEGKLVNTNGTNIADNTYNVEFKIYQDGNSSGAGSTLLWTEDYLVAGSTGMPSTGGVTLTNGTFQVNLGSICSGFAASTCGAKTNAGVDFNQQTLWLSVQVGNTSSCTVTSSTTSFNTACGGDGEMTPFIRLTATPQALNSDMLDGLSSSAFGQLAATPQTWTGQNIFAPTTNINGLTARQTSSGSPSADIFDVQGTNGSTNFLQITSTAANQATVALQSVGGTNALSLTSAGALTFTGAANSTWDLGAAHTLSLQTTNNGPITTGTGLLTVGGNLSFGQAATVGSVTPATANAAGFALSVQAGTANGSTTGNVGGVLTLSGGNAAGSGANNGGNVLIQGGAKTSTGTSGSVIVRPQASNDSTTAFLVQNAASANLLQVDTTNSNVTVLGNNSAQLQQFVAATNTLPAGRSFNGSVVANGYLYVIGGDNGTAPTNSIDFAPLGANGQPGAWQCQGTSATTSCGGSATLANSNSLPAVREDVAATTANGYLYVVGSSATTGNDATQVVYYAKLNADGTTGAWTSQGSNLLGTARTEFGLVSANGYLYAIAGNNGSVGLATTEYAKLNADGSTGAWTASTSLPVSRFSGAAAVANGYVYYLAGLNAATDTHTVMFAPLNSTTGALGTWKCQGANTAAECVSGAVNSNTVSATGVDSNGAAVANGYIYSIGGISGSTIQTPINFGQLNSDGTTGAWAASTNGLTGAGIAAREAFGYTPVVANGYIYVAGGNNAGAATSVFFGSVSRLQVGGALDLVGIGGEGLNNGATGGELTVGNASVIGTLSVRDIATFAQGLSVNGPFTVSSTALIQTATNSTTAFQVQNAAGTNLFAVDTSGSNINIGNSAIAETIQLGTTATNTSNTQTINIGNTAAAGTTNVTIGASPTSAGSGTTTVQSKGALTLDSGAGISIGGTSATSLSFGSTANNASTTFKQTASATAFQVQNASSKPVLTVDTSTNQVTLGQAGSGNVNGQLAFANNTNTNIATLLSGVSSASYSLTLPTNVGSTGQCLQLSTVSGSSGPLVFGACGTSAGLAKNAADTSSATGISNGNYLYSFTNATTGPATSSGVLSLNNSTNTGAALNVSAGATGISVSASAVPSADQVSITNAGQGETTAGINGLGINYVGGSAAVESAGEHIDLTPGGTSGGTWSGLRVVANGTGAVSGVNENGIKLDGPTTPGSGTETGLYIGTGWDVGLDVESGDVNLTGYTSGGNPSDPASPASGNLAVYAKKVSGRMLLKIKGPTGLDSPLQPALFGNNVVLYSPTSGTTVTGGFGTLWAKGGSAGTVSTVTPSTTSPAISNQIHRTKHLNAVTTTNQDMGIKISATDGDQFWTGNAAGLGGFFFQARFIVEAWPAATDRIFAGLASGTTAVVGSDTVAGDVAGLWHDTTDSSTTFSMMTRNNVTTNKATITVSNAIAAGNAYDFYEFCGPNCTTIFYRLDDIVNGVTYEGSTATDLPRNTIFMGPQVEMSNGTANVTANTVGIGINRIYVESDH